MYEMNVLSNTYPSDYHESIAAAIDDEVLHSPCPCREALVPTLNQVDFVSVLKSTCKHFQLTVPMYLDSRVTICEYQVARCKLLISHVCSEQILASRNRAWLEQDSPKIASHKSEIREKSSGSIFHINSLECLVSHPEFRVEGWYLLSVPGNV